jgi:hypothetical protein
MAGTKRITKVRVKGAAAKNPKFTPIGMATRFGANGRAAVKTKGTKGKVSTKATAARASS